MSLTTEQRAALRSLAKATAGDTFDFREFGVLCTKKGAELIATAVTALPGLLDDLDAAEAELLSLRVEISGLRLLIEQPNAAEKRLREALERIRDSRIDNYRSGTARNAALNELDWAQNIAKAALDEPEART